MISTLFTFRPIIWIVCLLFMLFFSLTAGCSNNMRTIPDLTAAGNPEPGEIPKMAAKEARRLDYDQKRIQGLEKISPEKIDIEPVAPIYNPLDGHLVSLAAINEKLELVLFSLAKNVHMNLLIDPDIDMSNKLVTVNFEKAPASVILDKILQSAGLAYTINHNLIHVRGVVERLFKLNFLDTSTAVTYKVGGNVLGGGGSDSVNVGGLTGSFAINGKGGKETNPYKQMEAMVRKSMTPNGHYSLNSMTGTLYVRDTINTIRAISKIVTQIKEMMSRQILIEAQIIEVQLRDNYQFGIDWNSLRSSLAKSTSLVDSLSWNLKTGLVLNQAAGIPTNQFNAVIHALRTYGHTQVVSNPTIRVKHDQPALISVGTSNTYIKNLTVTSGGTDGTSSTDIETSSVFDGLILGVIPFIENNNRLVLQVNPIKSDVEEKSLDLINVGNGVNVTLPKVDVKELSTVIGMHSGDTVVLGGLIDRRKSDISQGVPLLARIPILGQLVRNDFKLSDNTELVIILKVTIL